MRTKRQGSTTVDASYDGRRGKQARNFDTTSMQTPQLFIQTREERRKERGFEEELGKKKRKRARCLVTVEHTNALHPSAYNRQPDQNRLIYRPY